MNEEPYLEIPLNKNWDFPQTPYPKDEKNKNCGVFYPARDGEVEQLKNIILEKKKSSTLLSGPRGRGKTALIYNTIRTINVNRKDYQSKKIIIPVLIDALQLQAQSKVGNTGEHEVDFLVTLENIINQLKFSVRFWTLNNWGVILYLFFYFNWPELIKYLYFQYKLRNLYLKNLSTKWTKEQSRLTTRTYFFSLVNIIWVVIVFIILFIVLKTGFYPDPKIIKIFLTIFSSVIVVSVVHKVSKKENFLLDRNYNTLEHEFRKLFKFVFKIVRLVFVVDELDYFKLKNDCKDGKIHHPNFKYTCLPKIFKAYKNLFQFIDASFIFIGDDDIYKMINDKKEDILSTVFTDVLYLSPPKQSDLFEYLDLIVDKEWLKDLLPEKQEEWNKKWNKARYYLMYLGEGDFRKTALIVKGYTKEDLNKLVIKNYQFGEKQENLSILYEYVSKIYDSEVINEPLRNNENEELYKKMYEIIKPDLWEEENGVGGDYSNNLKIKKVQKHLLSRLREIKAFEDVEDVEKKDEHREKSVEGYEIKDTNYINLKDLPKKFNEPSRAEKELIEKFEEQEKELLDLAKRLDIRLEEDTLLKAVQTLEGEYLEGDSLTQIVKEVKNKKDNIEKGIKQNQYFRVITVGEEVDPLILHLKNLSKTIKGEYFDIFKKRILELEKGLEQSDLSIEPQLFNMLPDLRNEIISSYPQHVIFYIDEDFSKQLIVLDIGVPDDKIKEWQDFINSSGYSHSYKIVNTNVEIKEIKEWFQDFFINSVIGYLFIQKGIPCKKSNKEFVLNQIIEPKIDYSNNVNTFLTTLEEKVLAKGHFKFLVKIKEGALLNFVVGFNKNEEDNYHWWMVRLDTRELCDKSGCGILKKDFGKNWDEYEKTTIKKRAFPADTKKEVFLDFSNKHIKLYSVQKKSKIGKKNREEIWAQVKRNITQGQLGFFNEKGGVELEILESSFDKK